MPTCVVCGREMTPRKSWTTRPGNEVKYCSDACRRDRKRAAGQGSVLEDAIRAALVGRDTTVCPSEIARAQAPSGDEADWRPLMEPVRQAARRMVAGGELEITQHGHVVDPSTAKGPIRLRRPR